MTGGFTDESKSLTGGLSDSEVARRKAWLELNPTDEQVIKEEIASVIEANVDDLMEMMYQHFLSFNETRSYFPDETTLKRARSAQKQYFLGLTKGNYNADYVRERLAIGSTHHRRMEDVDCMPCHYNRLSFGQQRHLRY